MPRSIKAIEKKVKPKTSPHFAVPFSKGPSFVLKNNDRNIEVKINDALQLVGNDIAELISPKILLRVKKGERIPVVDVHAAEILHPFFEQLLLSFAMHLHKKGPVGNKTLRDLLRNSIFILEDILPISEKDKLFVLKVIDRINTSEIPDKNKLSLFLEFLRIWKENKTIDPFVNTKDFAEKYKKDQRFLEVLLEEVNDDKQRKLILSLLLNAIEEEIGELKKDFEANPPEELSEEKRREKIEKFANSTPYQGSDGREPFFKRIRKLVQFHDVFNVDTVKSCLLAWQKILHALKLENVPMEVVSFDGREVPPEDRDALNSCVDLIVRKGSDLFPDVVPDNFHVTFPNNLKMRQTILLMALFSGIYTNLKKIPYFFLEEYKRQYSEELPRIVIESKNNALPLLILLYFGIDPVDITEGSSYKSIDMKSERYLLNNKRCCAYEVLLHVLKKLIEEERRGGDKLSFEYNIYLNALTENLLLRMNAYNINNFFEVLSQITELSNIYDGRQKQTNYSSSEFVAWVVDNSPDLAEIRKAFPKNKTILMNDDNEKSSDKEDLRHGMDLSVFYSDPLPLKQDEANTADVEMGQQMQLKDEERHTLSAQKETNKQPNTKLDGVVLDSRYGYMMEICV